RAVEITAAPKSKTYGETDPALTYAISSGSLLPGDAFTGSLSRETGESVGDYAILKGGVALNANYALTYVGEKLSIGKASLTISANDQVKCETADFNFTGTEYIVDGLKKGDFVASATISSMGA